MVCLRWRATPASVDFGISKFYPYFMSEETLVLRGRVRNTILSFVVKQGVTYANAVATLYDDLCTGAETTLISNGDSRLVWARVHLHHLKKMGLVTSAERKRPNGSIGRGRYVEWRATALGESVVR